MPLEPQAFPVWQDALVQTVHQAQAALQDSLALKAERAQLAQLARLDLAVPTAREAVPVKPVHLVCQGLQVLLAEPDATVSADVLVDRATAAPPVLLAQAARTVPRADAVQWAHLDTPARTVLQEPRVRTTKAPLVNRAVAARQVLAVSTASQVPTVWMGFRETAVLQVLAVLLATVVQPALLAAQVLLVNEGQRVHRASPADLSRQTATLEIVLWVRLVRKVSLARQDHLADAAQAVSRDPSVQQASKASSA